MAIYCEKHRTRGMCLDCAKEKRETSAIASNDRVIKPGGRKEGIGKPITAENIIHNMKRYDHQDPHATYSINHIARMIGEAPSWTRQKLQEMKEQGLVSSFQNDGVRWKAL